MAWVKIDDHFDEHPKLAVVGPLGWGVWLAGLAYSNRNLTDGFIPLEVAEAIGGRWRIRVPTDDGREAIWTLSVTSGMQGEDLETEWVIDLLVRAGLWEREGNGYRIHDYSDYQPSKAETLALREKRAASGKLGGKAKANAWQSASKVLSKTEAKVYPDPDPDPDPVSVPESEQPTSSTSSEDLSTSARAHPHAQAGGRSSSNPEEPEPEPPEEGMPDGRCDAPPDCLEGEPLTLAGARPNSYATGCHLCGQRLGPGAGVADGWQQVNGRRERLYRHRGTCPRMTTSGLSEEDDRRLREAGL